ncbi:S10 family serine carboxypeptidase-like protein [Nodosilinea sp. E11]|uniref:S10 family peptidase n=1 Tax=Nodosilinea sp. E11 TaxID=3037479 RepID=UPI0029345897|nr:peptidase S10 [Nodosilinea sp. E11]WOD40077.1 peptidase S10 [Nodosilinea sp. E11]
MADSFQRQGNTTEHLLTTPQGSHPYTASAQWQTLYENDKPVAELFHVAYTIAEQDPAKRPITFVFNGGPGAASAYLHMGALGPRRVVFNPDGSLPRPPVQVADNAESWLSFSDLVFIDPLGTGFSRTLPKEGEKADASDEKSAKADKEADKSDDKPDEKAKKFWAVDRDLNSLGEFIQTYLSAHHRWLSPVFIAGESYGGFRVAKLCRKLQQDYGVGLCGAILISPVMEFMLLEGNDYSLSGWATVIPSMAATAAYHGRVNTTDSPAAHGAKAADFARKTLIPLLALGSTAPAEDQQRVFGELAALIGLAPEIVQRHRGRIDITIFARELLREQQRILGLYDGSVTAIDPFPDRLLSEGTDPTLEGIDRMFTGAINSHLRSTLGVDTSLTYNLLSFEVFKAWEFLPESDYRQGFAGSVDDLRVGMALNPYLQVYITHGIYDLVTPYFSSEHLKDLMNLNDELRPNLTLRHFQGGHMFYTWEESRRQWFDNMQRFYHQAMGK